MRAAVTIDGFLEGVEPFQLRGWALDPSNPDQKLRIEFLINERVLGTAQASLYRKDLEDGAVGNGNHAFIYNFEERLAEEDLLKVYARVVKSDGTYQVLKKYMPTQSIGIEIRKPELTFEGIVCDPKQRPVFVLGAARSGTSAMAQALLKLGSYKGHQEGHVLDLLAHLSVSLSRFYDEKADDAVKGQDTTISQVPMLFFDGALNEVFIRTMRSLFPEGAWIDKTPNSNMVYLAPRFLQIWPNARFIFMKRRFFENVVSRSRKFPLNDFGRNCREWSNAMNAWLEVRGNLHSVAVEVDQDFLIHSPAAAAASLKNLLNLSDDQFILLEQAFKYDRPERTSNSGASYCDISNMGWGTKELEEFKRTCSKPMDAYGYALDSNYYRPECSNNGLVLV